MRRLGTVALVGLLLGLAVTPVAAATAIEWRRCSPDEPANFECAEVRVPLDYADPSGRKIDIAISRVKATGERRGVLVMNPGGPGSAGLDMPVTKRFPPEIGQHYDLVGFDPRGIGSSSPVTCGLERGWSPIPFERAKFDEHVVQTKAIADQCWATQPDLLPHLTTRNTARDLDAIRAALGEPRISYYGISYGTYLGAVYTQLFPQRAERIVLDSNVDPDRAWRGMVQIWAVFAERAFGLFADWAAVRQETYGLGGSVDEVRNTFRGLLNNLDRHPVTIEGETYDGNRVRLFARGIGQRETKNLELAALMRKLLDAERTITVAAAEPPADNRAAGSLAVMCGDARWPTDPAQYLRDALRDTQRYPMMGGQTSNISPCAFWPNPVEPRTRIRDNQAESILLVQNEYDTQTPLEGAAHLRELLPDNSRMLLAQGAWRHGAYPGHCADDTVTRYLLDGELPAQDVTCS
ncbi:alpha/beta hydrolase [Amycolatopsis magusensis]|uniref:alpha/beta hydrolase n=1 Tax=Amycolatopsis magusensis TaxID=882444 RepID=UPI0024A8F15A|nr:alpha/beta hydrolase [Amycolatopsis magusensis]MDI5980243.1 alpha/beta hydrolase [Amycolatopsis magusensis]